MKWEKWEFIDYRFYVQYDIKSILVVVKKIGMKSMEIIRKVSKEEKFGLKRKNSIGS